MIKRNFLIISSCSVLAILALIAMSSSVVAVDQKIPQDVCEKAGGDWNPETGCSCVPLGIAINGNKCPKPEKDATGVEGNVIFAWLLAVIKFLSFGVGIAVTGGILSGSIMYATASDNAAQVQKAVMIIVNAMIGLFLYLFMFAILNYLIPGGIFTA